jgi:hypothetical protein
VNPASENRKGGRCFFFNGRRAIERRPLERKGVFSNQINSKHKVKAAIVETEANDQLEFSNSVL